MTKKILLLTVATVLLLPACSLFKKAPVSLPESSPPAPVSNTSLNNEVVTEVNVEGNESTEPASYVPGRLQAYDQMQFDAAIADGKTVLLDFYAPWCPTCRGNEPVLDAFFDGSREVVGFRVDYDTATMLRQQYGVTVQSTYIVLNDVQELNRYTGTLNAKKLSLLFE